VKRVTWVQPEDLLRHELRQSADEGKDVGPIRDAWSAAGYAADPPVGGVSPQPGGPEARALAESLLDRLATLPDPTAADEPSDWPGIVTALDREAVSGVSRPEPARDKVKGAWVGRAVGCVLGKPVEKIPRVGIEAILRSTGRWPLRRYFTAVGLDPQVAQRWPWNRASRSTSLEENIDGTPEDDDINYTLMALRIVEQHGSGFDAGDVATGWLLDLPAGRAFTAERVAYRNLLSGIEPPRTATVTNPFREWIGAQIRTDLYGWVNPGDPLRAAEWAFRDASVSHTRNGLYGAMFVAAMAATAMGTDEGGSAAVERVLDAGASVVPPGSRMAAAIALGRRLGAAGGDPAHAYAALEAEFADLHWVHALNNSALVAYALTAGRGSFDDAICLTVTGGWDTDSNGATVGAVMGALTGAAGIDPYWTDPLRGTVSSSIPGCDGATFDELTERTIAIAGRVWPAGSSNPSSVPVVTRR
jgi:ADP-ribosylglycohydrolase